MMKYEPKTRHWGLPRGLSLLMIALVLVTGCDAWVSEAERCDYDGDGFLHVDCEGATDCDDRDPGRHPQAAEIPYDGVDQDCDGDDLTDVDGDGAAAAEAGGSDCDDEAPDVHPGAAEVPYDGIDQDCDGSDLRDVDGDGFPGGEGGSDCDDGEVGIHPGVEDPPCDGVDQDCDGSDQAVEIPYDQIDQDCDGSDLSDLDGDGFAAAFADEGGTDCDDTQATIHPDAEDLPCDGIDQDCSGADLVDSDGDGSPACGVSTLDCDDEDPRRAPGFSEIPCDDIDQDCDGSDLVDLDGDGYGCAEDCDPEDGAIHPGVAETPYDGVDQDCDGGDLRDVDGDGAESVRVGGSDCDDEDAAVTIYPPGDPDVPLIPIPPGRFIMGSDLGDDDAAPAHAVDLSGFCVQQVTVTNDRYRGCVEAGVCLEPFYDRSTWGEGYYGDPDFADHPVNYIDWQDASSYCAFIGGALPTEAQWERGARGGCADRGEGDPTRCDDEDWEDWPWPWGGITPTCDDAPSFANLDSCIGGPVSVDSFPEGASPDGLHNMAGNVWEWTRDVYVEDLYLRGQSVGEEAPPVPMDPEGPTEGANRVIRGGGYNSEPAHSRVYYRGRSGSGALKADAGFRCTFPAPTSRNGALP